jgi:IclR family transcriptional regulator, acetate operon repressor
MPTQIRVLERAADILSCFSSEHPSLGVSEISVQVRLDKATISRILSTLKSRDLVYVDPVSRKYSIGPRIYQLAQIGPGNITLRTRASPHCMQLRDQTGETVTLNVRFGFDRVCILQFESPHEIKRTMEVGRPYPLYSGASGRVLMAFMSDKEVDALFARTPLVAFTPTTITDRSALMASLRRIRTDGFALGRGERVLGGGGVVAPVFDYTGKVVASVGITMPETRMEPARVPDFIKAVKSTARCISEDLGHRENSGSD